MKIIGFQDIRALGVPPEECYEWVSDMIARKGECLLPAKIHIGMPENVFCNVMPSIIRYDGGMWGGVKVVTRYPDRKPTLDSKILLFNADSGSFLALMDGNWITAMRTGAVAAHSVLHFAKKGFRTIGMTGLGNVARTSLLVLAAMIPDRPLTVKLLRYKDQAELFAERFRDYGNLEFRIVDTEEECIRGSDVIISCSTYYENDIAADDWFEPGVLVVPVHTRGFTNCDLFFDKVFADDTDHVRGFRHFSEFRQFAEVSDVVNGRRPGRENDSERILAYNIGVSIHDINYAIRIYRMLEQDPDRFGSLTDADMQDPTEKFWI